jgi:hypothetical protein
MPAMSEKMVAEHCNKQNLVVHYGNLICMEVEIKETDLS